MHAALCACMLIRKSCTIVLSMILGIWACPNEYNSVFIRNLNVGDHQQGNPIVKDDNTKKYHTVHDVDLRGDPAIYLYIL